MNINIILERKEVLDYLISRELLNQYKKCKLHIYNGNFDLVNLKLRKPKKDKIFYFRINKQYRAYCLIKNNELRVFKIDNHS